MVKAVITSAEPLSKKSLDSIKEAVLKLAGQGKSVEVSVAVEPKLLGGLQIVIGDRFIDLSVASRINDLSKTLDSVV